MSSTVPRGHEWSTAQPFLSDSSPTGGISRRWDVWESCSFIIYFSCTYLLDFFLFFLSLNCCVKMSRGAAGKNGQKNNSEGAGGWCASADRTAPPLRNFFLSSAPFPCRSAGASGRFWKAFVISTTRASPTSTLRSVPQMRPQNDPRRRVLCDFFFLSVCFSLKTF